MAAILVTGTSGFIGQHLAPNLAAAHQVVCITRKAKNLAGVTEVLGDFTCVEDLKKLDAYPIDAVIHLAGLTSIGTQEEQLRVNVLGTQGLLKYLIVRGCRKFVLASSIALVGLQSKLFCPLQLPIPDEHPCLDRCGYGFSKYVMEELARFIVRENSQVDISAIRLGVIVEGTPTWQPCTAASPLADWTVANLSAMSLRDCMRCLTLAATSPHKPGLRIMNAVGPRAYAKDPVPAILRSWYPAAKLDLSAYEAPGHDRDPIFDISRIRRELDFIPQDDLLTLP